MPFTSALNLRLAIVALAAIPAAAFAQGTAEQQQACTPDALKLCSDTIPDIGKTTACMKAHFAQLSPRCQSAFNDATSGEKPATRSASRKAEPAARTHVVTRAERHVANRETTEHERSAHDATVDPTVAPAPQVAGYPPFPSPDAPAVRAAPATGPRASIAAACQAGLIDSFTCQTTVPIFFGKAD